jgi:hypothetical protein
MKTNKELNQLIFDYTRAYASLSLHLQSLPVTKKELSEYLTIDMHALNHLLTYPANYTQPQMVLPDHIIVAGDEAHILIQHGQTPNQWCKQKRKEKQTIPRSRYDAKIKALIKSK